MSSEFLTKLQDLMIEHSAYLCVDARGNLCLTTGESGFPLIASKIDFSEGRESKTDIHKEFIDVFEFYTTPMFVLPRFESEEIEGVE